MMANNQYENPLYLRYQYYRIMVCTHYDYYLEHSSRWKCQLQLQEINFLVEYSEIYSIYFVDHILMYSYNLKKNIFFYITAIG